MSRLQRTFFWVLLGAMPFSACRCNDEDLNDLIPDVAVVPDPVEFQLRRVDADTALAVTVVNRGTADLTVRSITVEPAGAPYRVELPMDVTLPVMIPQGGRQPMQVVFHPPSRGPHNATLVVQSDDPDQGRLEVPLVGGGGPPRIRVTPDQLNFDLVNQGDTQQRTLEIANTGLDTLHVTRVYLEHGDRGFSLPSVGNFGSGDIPVTGQALTTVEMAASVTGAVTDVLHILSDADAAGDVAVPLLATANLGPIVTVVEKITRAQDYRTDLYLSVTLDASGTMDGEMDPYTLAWRVLERPPGSQSILEPTAVATEKTIYIDQVGIYRVEVTGTDTRGAIGKSVATIRAIRDLALRLTWEPDANAACRSAATPESQCGKTDVDIHLVAPGGMLGDYFTGCDLTPGCDNRCRPQMSGVVCRGRGLDSTYANRNPDWGIVGDPSDDPRLDIDDPYGYGPENISLNGPVEGDYLIQVHFCNDRLMDEGSVASVEVLFFGEPANPPLLGPAILGREGSVWLAGTVHYNPALPQAQRFTLTPLGNANMPVLVDGAANLCTQ